MIFFRTTDTTDTIDTTIWKQGFNYNLLREVAKVKYEPKSKVAELDGN